MCIKVKCQVATHYIHMQPEKADTTAYIGHANSALLTTSH